MQNKNGQSKNYFAWHCKTDGTVIDSNSASDGEEWFVMALFFASARWGDGEGIYNYKAEAQKILNAMLGKNESSDRNDAVTNMFNKKEKLVVFVPIGKADDFTDPSYHMPHYYELWARAGQILIIHFGAVLLLQAGTFKKVANPVTGLAPDFAEFNGNPSNPWGRGHSNFRYDAWRVAMNIAVDYEWFARDNREILECNQLLDFFYSEGLTKYGCIYTLEGKKLSNDHPVGLMAMNAVACLASTNVNRKEFLEELWNVQIPTGHFRYYDGMLYMLAMLQRSGTLKFIIWITNRFLVVLIVRIKIVPNKKIVVDRASVKPCNLRTWKDFIIFLSHGNLSEIIQFEELIVLIRKQCMTLGNRD